MSITTLTIWATVVALAATALLMAADIRQPARRSASGARGRLTPVAQAPTQLYKRPGLIRRLLALIGASALTIVAGLVLGIALLAAIVLAFLLLGSALG